MDSGALQASVKKHEGRRLRAYLDSVGVWTIGDGINLQTLVIDDEIADLLLRRALQSATITAQNFPEWYYLDTDARQNAFIEMVYNLGPTRLSYFRKMLDAIKAQDWIKVAAEALDSKWATQVGQRAITLIAMLQTGNFPAKD